MNARFPEVFELEFAEKLQLFEELWDDLAKHPELLPVPEWQLEELERRKANALANPDSGKSWDEVKRGILNRNG